MASLTIVICDCHRPEILVSNKHSSLAGKKKKRVITSKLDPSQDPGRLRPASPLGAAHAHLGAAGAQPRRLPDGAEPRRDDHQRPFPTELLQRRQWTGKEPDAHRYDASIMTLSAGKTN